jgi:hypothetical protein
MEKCCIERGRRGRRDSICIILFGEGNVKSKFEKSLKSIKMRGRNCAKYTILHFKLEFLTLTVYNKLYTIIGNVIYKSGPDFM